MLVCIEVEGEGHIRTVLAHCYHRLSKVQRARDLWLEILIQVVVTLRKWPNRIHRSFELRRFTMSSLGWRGLKMVFVLLLAFLLVRAVLLVVNAFLAWVGAAASLECHHVIILIWLLEYLLLQKGRLSRILLENLSLARLLLISCTRCLCLILVTHHFLWREDTSRPNLI
jgi:hypothetical protein